MGDNIELAQIEEGAPGAPNLVYGDEPTGDTDSETSDQEVMTIREGSPQEGVKQEVSCCTKTVVIGWATAMTVGMLSLVAAVVYQHIVNKELLSHLRSYNMSAHLTNFRLESVNGIKDQIEMIEKSIENNRNGMSTQLTGFRTILESLQGEVEDIKADQKATMDQLKMIAEDAKQLVTQVLEGLVTYTTFNHTQKLYALVKKEASFDDAEVNNTTAMNTELIMNAFYNAIFSTCRHGARGSK